MQSRRITARRPTITQIEDFAFEGASRLELSDRETGDVSRCHVVNVENLQGMRKDPITTGHEPVTSEKMLPTRPPRNHDEDFLHDASLLYDAITRCNGVVTEKGAVDRLNRNGIHLKGIAKPSDKEMDLADFTSLLRRGMRTHAGPANPTLALRRFRQVGTQGGSSSALSWLMHFSDAGH